MKTHFSTSMPKPVRVLTGLDELSGRKVEAVLLDPLLYSTTLYMSFDDGSVLTLRLSEERSDVVNHDLPGHDRLIELGFFTQEEYDAHNAKIAQAADEAELKRLAAELGYTLTPKADA